MLLLSNEYHILPLYAYMFLNSVVIPGDASTFRGISFHFSFSVNDDNKLKCTFMYRKEYLAIQYIEHQLT